MKESSMEEKTPPCAVGDILIVKIYGFNRDPFTKYLGFMIFLKNVPLEFQEEGIWLRVEVTGLGKTYGFADFIEENK